MAPILAVIDSPRVHAWPIRIDQRIASAMVICAALACVSGSPPERDGGDSGPILVSFAKSMAWLPDGRELAYFVSRADGQCVVKAVRVLDGTERVLDPAPVSCFSDLARAARAPVLYAITTTSNGGDQPYSLIDLLSGRRLSPPNLAPTVRATLAEGGTIEVGGVLAVSPDGRVVVHPTSSGGTAAFHVDDGTSLHLPCEAGRSASPPVSQMFLFSPSGEDLLCPTPNSFRDMNTLQLAVVDLSTGASRDVQLPIAVWIAGEWGADGLLVYGRAHGSNEVVEVNAEADATIVVYRSTADQLVFSGAVSPDGERLALFEAGRCAFSDDGRQIAYDFGDSGLRVRAAR